MNTTLTVTEQEALEFIEFQKRYAFFKTLDSIGAFNLRNGAVTINFDKYGQIGSIEKKEFFRDTDLQA